MITILSILILAIAAICLGRQLHRKRSCASTGNASSSLPILTDEEMERMLEENDRVYEQLKAEGRALHAMFASHDSQRSKEANPKVANPAPHKRRNRKTNSSKPHKRRELRTQVAPSELAQQQMPQQNSVQANSRQVTSSQQNATQSAPRSTTLPLIQSRSPAATWFSRLLVPISIAACRLYFLVSRSVLSSLRMGPRIFRPDQPANLSQEPNQRRAA